MSEKPKKPGAKASDGKVSPARQRPPGRASTYSIEAAAKICAWLADGKSLRAYCRQADTPSRETVCKWLSENRDFADRYARAREVQADAIVDEILDIADDSTLDPNDRRVKIDARKWIAGKLRPKVYGDRVQADVNGKLTLEQLVLGSFKTTEQAA
jgi:hypothetical protein